MDESSGGNRNMVRYVHDEDSKAGSEKRVCLMGSELPGGFKASGDKDMELMGKLDPNAFPPGMYMELYEFCKRPIAKKPWFLPQVQTDIVGFSEQEEHHRKGMFRWQENILNQDRWELSETLNAPASLDVSKEVELGRWNESRKREMQERMEGEEKKYRSVIRNGAQYSVYNTREEDLEEDGVSTAEELQLARVQIRKHAGK
jgi:hypothetical protein